jgi:cytochrome c oxidase assembly protein subunit 11
LRAQPVTAQAVPSIAPLQATRYFQKTECFCFTPQHFDASQTRELTVRFIVDP